MMIDTFTAPHTWTFPSPFSPKKKPRKKENISCLHFRICWGPDDHHSAAPMGRARTLSRRRAQSGASSEESWQGASLTASERAYMIRKAKEASVALVDHAHTLDGPVQWHYTGKFRGIQMYRGEGSYDRVGTTGTEFLCGVTTMMGSIEEVVSYFDQQTTERMLAKKAEDVLDCGVLYMLVQGGPDNPFYRVSAKYQLYEGPSAFSRERDYCYLECQNTFRHASGRRGWVLSMHSIKLPSCPELDGVVRGSMYQSGYVFVEAEREGYMDVMHSLQINFKSTNRLPHFLLNSALKRRILSVVTISREIQTSRMGRQTLLKKKDLMPKRARALCVNCSRKFSLFVRKTRCRVCGEVVCQPCAPQVMISTKRGPVKTRVCSKCYHLSASDEYEPVGALPNSNNAGDPRRGQNETRYSDIMQDHDNPDMYHEEDEGSMDEDEDEDGLEEQSDYSVFAASRFTDASRDSVATSQFGASRSNFESHFEGSSQFSGTSSELDDSQYYDGGVSEDSFVSGVSGTSTSYWHGGNSAASSAMGWNQASGVKPTDGYIYDPQASMMNSNFYGASKYGSDFGSSKYSVNEEPAKRAGRYNAAAPIPEDEPTSHREYTISPNTSYNSSTDYNSSQATNYNSTQASNFNSTQVSDFKATQGTNFDASHAGYNSNHANKTVSIQNLAKARSARYGIKSEFPPSPPPPPPLSPPPEEIDEDEEDDSPLHLGALKTDNPRNTRDRKQKGIAARKMFTPPPPKDGRRENDARASSNRAPRVPRSKEFATAAISRNTDSRVSQASSRDSRGFGSTRSSAILEQMRRNRRQTPQPAPESERSSAVLKSLEEEHLNRMREIERMQEMARDKAARRSVASSASRSSMQSSQRSQGGLRSQSSRGSAAGVARKQPDKFRRSVRNSPPHSPPAAKKQQEKFRRSARSSLPHSPIGPRAPRSQRSPGSPIGPPPGSPPGPPPISPPGTPPSMRGHRLPLNGSFNQRANRSFGRRTNAKSDFGNSQLLLSNRSNGAFANSGVHSEELMFNSQRSGFHSSKESNSSFRGRRLDTSHASSKGSSSSFGASRRLDASQVSNTPMSIHPDDLAFDASQLSVDKSKFASSFAILETPGESADHVAMIERPSAEQDSNSSSSFDEDLLNQSLAGMAHHISSMRARAPYQLPDEELRPSDELRKRQEEHRKRMEELTRLAANHVGEGNIRDSTSTLGGLHDSSISLSSGNHFGDSTISSISSASSVDIDDVDFDFETRPLGRTKRSGTIPFALENLDQVPDVEDEELSEGPDDSDTSFRLSEGAMEHDDDSEPINVKPVYRTSKESSGPINSYHSREKSIEHERKNALGDADSSYRLSDQSAECARSSTSDGVDSSYRMSTESVKHGQEQDEGLVNSAYRPSEESIEHERQGGYINLTFLPSEVSAKHEREPATQAKLQEHEYENTSEDVDSVHRPSEKNEHRGVNRSNHSSEESVEREGEHNKSAYRPSEESVERESEHDGAKPTYRFSEECVDSKSEDEDGKPLYRSSVGSVERESEEEDSKPSYRSIEKSIERESEQVGAASPFSDTSRERKNDQQNAYRSSVDSESESEPEAADGAYRLSGEPVTPPKSAPKSQTFDNVIDDSSRLASSDKSSPANKRNEESDITRSPFKTAEFSHQKLKEIPVIHDEHATQKFNSSKAEFSNTMSINDLGSPRDSSVSDIDEDLMNRPTNELFEMVRANRAMHSADASSLSDTTRNLEASHVRRMEASHVRRMDELNRIAVDHLGDRISDLNKDMLGSSYQPMKKASELQGNGGEAVDDFHAPGKLSEVDEQHSDDDSDTGSPFNTAEFSHQKLKEIPGIDDEYATQKFNSPKAEFSNTMSINDLGSPRDSSVSDIDEDLMNRPTNELFEMVRANRAMHSADASSSSDTTRNLEASHVRRMEASHVRRMDELNRIAVDHLGDRISNLDEDMFGSSYQPAKKAPKFQPHSSQLVLGEGGQAVDEFFASRVASSGKLSQVDEQDADDDDDTRCSPHDSAELDQGNLKSIPSIDEEGKAQQYNSANAQFSSSVSSSVMSEELASPRDSSGSMSGSDIDEDLMNRPTNELFEMIRANRAIHAGAAPHSSDVTHNLEASHVRRMEASHVRRMDELNRIAVDHLGDRISDLNKDMLGSSYQPMKKAPELQGNGGEAVNDFHAPGKLSEVDEQHSDDDSDTGSPFNTAEFSHQKLKEIPGIDDEYATQKFNSPKAEFSNTMSINDLGSPRDSSVSDIDEDLMNRPTNELFEMVHANRAMHSADASSLSDTTRSLEASHVRRMEASHVRRMDELNRIAVDHLGDRISNLDEDLFGSSYQPAKKAPKFQPHSSQLVLGEGGQAVDEFFASRVASSGKLSQADEQHTDDDDDTRCSPRDSAELDQGNLKSIPSIDEEGKAQQYNSANAQFSSSVSSSVMSEELASPRDSSVSDIDEDLMNRPTNELFEMVRANRAMHAGGASSSSASMLNLKASHMRRMDELNRIAVDHLGDRISNLDQDMLGSAYQPGRSLHPNFRDEEEEMQWRSTDVMEEVETKHSADMERLRRRILQLEEECRESIASVLTPDEMDLSELDDEEPAMGFNGHQSYHGGRNFNPQSSFVSTSDLSASVISEHAEEEPMPARVLLEQITKLTQLQQDMAEVDDEDDDEEYRERIKDQYRALRSIQAETQRERRSSSLSQRSSLSEENWI
ncbi:hypothetical protein PF005_g20713 [Phytophthora fragariae]|uniref:FYVE-type domain-containing protein n=4 Tax=Phytophthora fragariae TaxID=53985 RepID=A0A6A4CIQ2_9STRA|nr:hypothetical protein PF005_g20713 [Phytophthora fragariae]KAE9289791.1 hypothetical protein PF001_g19875 [Phytophthora fragariae]